MPETSNKFVTLDGLAQYHTKVQTELDSVSVVATEAKQIADGVNEGIDVMSQRIDSHIKEYSSSMDSIDTRISKVEWNFEDMSTRTSNTVSLLPDKTCYLGNIGESSLILQIPETGDHFRWIMKFYSETLPSVLFPTSFVFPDGFIIDNVSVYEFDGQKYDGKIWVTYQKWPYSTSVLS